MEVNNSNIVCVLSDTHGVGQEIIRYIVADAVKRGVGLFVHCGDLEPQDFSAELFANLPVVYAVPDEQLDDKAYEAVLRNLPKGWVVTTPPSPQKRVVYVNGVRSYVGHKRSYDLAYKADSSFKDMLNALRRDYDGLRFAFAGHMHYATLVQTLLVTFLNPGAVSQSPDGYEYAIVDLKTGQVVFTRVPNPKNTEEPFTVGIISDSLRISKLDADLWGKLTKEFNDRAVKEVIHCGNIVVADIGRAELANFEVHFRLRPEQMPYCPKELPKNWHLIPDELPIVTINDRRLYVHPSLARIILENSEAEMHHECLKISESHPDLSFILYGGNTRDAFYCEDPEGMTKILSPGDLCCSRKFATVCFPRTEITFATVPADQLPPLQAQP